MICRSIIDASTILHITDDLTDCKVAGSGDVLNRRKSKASRSFGQSLHRTGLEDALRAWE